ncbi:MAG TPA: long-chain fatty acid--CoA ligase, partial [Xanthobacteraceae bacterium]|nr:long-chain fatty acid--CoA ligase [Xanthobacteraceae bacterium]
IDAGALITCGRVAETKHAELALHIAAETYSIRYVCAFGSEVPDGIVPLDDIWTDGATASEPQTVTAAADTAVITFDIGSHGPAPVARTHTELMVGGLAAVLETGLPHQAAILGTMLPSSFAVLASTIVPWLLSGGTLALHHPFDLDSFARQIAQSPAALAVLPGPLVSKLADAGAIGTAPAKISAIWRAPEQQRLSPPWRGPAPLVDVLAFGEVALLPLRRGADGHPATLLAGSQKAPSTAADAAVLMTLARTDMGTLAVGGPMVPRALRSRPEQATEMVDTGYSCKIDPQNNLLIIEARTAPADGGAFAGRAASA